MTPRDRFEYAKTLFKEGSYEKAIENLRIISYERGTSYADSVQLLLADCYFNREQFILAASEYKDLLKFHTNSPLVPEARYKSALSYAHISPKTALDQNYTMKAIVELQTFTEYYPTHPLVREAEQMIISLRNKLALKDFETAQLYEKMSKLKAALVYYNGILENYHDSDYADLSHFKIINIHVALKKYQNARVEIEKFLTKYPNSVEREEVIKIKEKIKNL
jgi:outer membrane protein assembly factor BamD